MYACLLNYICGNVSYVSCVHKSKAESKKKPRVDMYVQLCQHNFRLIDYLINKISSFQSLIFFFFFTEQAMDSEGDNCVHKSLITK